MSEPRPAAADRDAPALVPPGSRLSVATDAGAFRLLSETVSGFAIRAEDAPYLGGFVEVTGAAGERSRCLVMMAEEACGVRHYEFKQRTEDRGMPPVDHVRQSDAPVALIG